MESLLERVLEELDEISDSDKQNSRVLQKIVRILASFSLEKESS